MITLDFTSVLIISLLACAAIIIIGVLFFRLSIVKNEIPHSITFHDKDKVMFQIGEVVDYKIKDGLVIFTQKDGTVIFIDYKDVIDRYSKSDKGESK